MAFWKPAELIEYSGEVSKTKSIFSLLFLIVISTVMGYLILKLVPYTRDEFTDYEQTGKEIKITGQFEHCTILVANGWCVPFGAYLVG